MSGSFIENGSFTGMMITTPLTTTTLFYTITAYTVDLAK